MIIIIIIIIIVVVVVVIHRHLLVYRIIKQVSKVSNVRSTTTLLPAVIER